MELKDTVRLMLSDDYRERFKAEYWQTKVRYERLKKITTQLEAEGIKNMTPAKALDGSPFQLLQNQQSLMRQYLHILELRAELEHIQL